MPETFSQMLERQSFIHTVESIENLLWLIVGLLVILIALQIHQIRSRTAEKRQKTGDWSKDVEQAYNKGDYDAALEILDSTELLFPASAWVLYWRGRCFFQQERWEDAARTFEELLRREPIFRKSVRDYLAFIEINDLVDGVEGYKLTDS